ncbi:MAG: imidazole glycerol phosphate synthase subunit HisH [Rhodothermia bacterium]|nr:imidazole glycerol phosphate synthase subunit HisH [Rhodothermia bacterium]
MTVAIVKYNAGNVRSVVFAMKRLGVDPVWTDDPDELERADKVIFPGVGEAGSAMRYLSERGLDDVISNLKQPVLGICLGLQLLCESSEENDTAGLGVFPYEVKRFEPKLKVPHIGWNAISELRGPLFNGVSDGSFAYFVHSYYAVTGDLDAAETDYVTPFASAVCKGNFFAVQFHPEKSGPVGGRILGNFLAL